MDRRIQRLNEEADLNEECVTHRPEYWIKRRPDGGTSVRRRRPQRRPRQRRQRRNDGRAILKGIGSGPRRAELGDHDLDELNDAHLAQTVHHGVHLALIDHHGDVCAAQSNARETSEI